MFNKDYWNGRYAEKNVGWDIGKISTPLKEYIDSLKAKDISILIPGCGNAYEAEYLLQSGFENITLIDFSPLPVKNISEKLSDFIDMQLTVICGDFFELNKQFDLILEQTFFCALHPSQRPDYVNKMAELLNENGKLTGVLFDRSFEGGPPFGGTKEEYEKLFGTKFNIHKMEVCYNSIAPRKGAELFIELIKLANKA